MILISLGMGPPHLQCGLRSQIALRFKTANKFIIGIERAEDWRAVGFLHLRPAEASRVALGFDRGSCHYDFATTSTILAAVHLALGHGHNLSGDPESLVGGLSLTVAVVTGKWRTTWFSPRRDTVNYVRNFLYRGSGGYKPWLNEPFAAAVAASDCARHWNARAI